MEAPQSIEDNEDRMEGAGMLRQRVLDVAQRATQSGALKRIVAGHRLLPENALALRFLLFSAEAPFRKAGGYAIPKPQVLGAEPRRADFFDPFAKENVEEDLFVAKVYDDHFLVLNKFAVVEEHLVLATVEFEEQETPLNAKDLRAAWKSMADLDAFAFFNCGYESGASQPHKHMQLISYPSIKAYCGLDMPPLLHFIHMHLNGQPTDRPVQLAQLPFHHYVHRLTVDEHASDEEAAALVLGAYTSILTAMRGSVYGAAADKPLAYNLLLTRVFLFVVPRKTPAFEGIEVNSIGFIGSFFERNDEQLAFFKQHGGLELLARVGFPSLAADEQQ